MSVFTNPASGAKEAAPAVPDPVPRTHLDQRRAVDRPVASKELSQALDGDPHSSDGLPFVQLVVVDDHLAELLERRPFGPWPNELLAGADLGEAFLEEPHGDGALVGLR